MLKCQLQLRLLALPLHKSSDLVLRVALLLLLPLLPSLPLHHTSRIEVCGSQRNARNMV